MCVCVCVCLVTVFSNCLLLWPVCLLTRLLMHTHKSIIVPIVLTEAEKCLLLLPVNLFLKEMFSLQDRMCRTECAWKKRTLWV